MKLRTAITLSALVTVLALAGCKKSEAPVAPAPPAVAPPAAPTPAPAPAPVGVTVSSIDLGSAVGADQRVTAPKTEFAPTDTIYAVVNTSGSAQSVTLAAKWTYQDGQTVNESSQSIAPTGPAATAFQVAKPDGFPAGKYKVEITKDGSSAGTREFEVK